MVGSETAGLKLIIPRENIQSLGLLDNTDTDVYGILYIHIIYFYPQDDFIFITIRKGGILIRPFLRNTSIVTLEVFPHLGLCWLRVIC